MVPGRKWYPKLRLALEEQVLQGAPLLISGQLLHAPGKPGTAITHGAKAFTVAYSTRELAHYIKKHNKMVSLCEVVPNRMDRDSAEAVGRSLLPMRMFFDLDLTVPKYDEKYHSYLSAVVDVARQVLQDRLGYSAPPTPPPPEALPASPGATEKSTEGLGLQLMPQHFNTVIAENSRKKGPHGAFKYSWHVVYTNLAVPHIDVEAKQICQAVHDALANSDDKLQQEAAECVDCSVYTPHRNLRLVGCRKQLNAPPLRMVPDVPLREALDLTLLTHYSHKPFLVPESLAGGTWAGLQPGTLAAVGNERKRKFSHNPEYEGHEAKDFKELAPYFRKLQKFLDTHELSQTLQWRGARVDRMQRFGDTVLARGGFSDAGQSHRCMHGELHNGNCSQRWLIRFNMCHYILQQACYPNARKLRCSKGADNKVPWKTLEYRGCSIRLECEN